MEKSLIKSGKTSLILVWPMPPTLENPILYLSVNLEKVSVMLGCLVVISYHQIQLGKSCSYRPKKRRNIKSGV